MSDVENFGDYVAQERARLTEQRNALLDERKSIDNALAALDREFAAVDAYEAAKTGRPVRNGAAPPRARRGSRRDEIMSILQNDQAARGDILNALGLKGDKAGEMSVSNALTSMVKAGQIARQNGVYFLP